MKVNKLENEERILSVDPVSYHRLLHKLELSDDKFAVFFHALTGFIIESKSGEFEPNL